MGVVYRARCTLEREVAIKFFPWVCLPTSRAEAIPQEALALAKLNHPNIATVHDVGEQDGTDYLVMECVPGNRSPKKLRSGAVAEKETPWRWGHKSPRLLKKRTNKASCTGT